MRNIPEDNFAYPTLIKFDTGSTGSGFLLHTGLKLFLISAKHVIFNKNNNNLHGSSIELTTQTKDISDNSVNIYKIDLTKINVIQHPTADVAALEIGSTQETETLGKHFTNYYEGITTIKKGATGQVSVDAEHATKLLDEVNISNDVFLYGYPTSLGLKDSPQFDYNKPLLRKGIVANLYKDKGTIILDCPVYYGNSGGPVVEVNQNGIIFEHKVIGVVSEFVPFVENWINTKNGLMNTSLTNSGYSVVVAMDKVFELIQFNKNQKR